MTWRPLTIVMYHYVRPLAESDFPAIKGLDLSLFVEQLDYLEQHYRIVTPEAVSSALAGGEALPSGACLLTFDDGYSDHFQHAFPILLERGISGVFFAPAATVLERRLLDVNRIHFLLAKVGDPAPLVETIDRAVSESEGLEPPAHFHSLYWKTFRLDPPEVTYIKRMLQHALPEDLRYSLAKDLFARFVTADEAAFAEELYMDLTDLQAMKAEGMMIGGHGDRHLWLGRIPPAEQAQEIDASLALLDRVGVAREDFVFCYCYGDAPPEARNLLREAGCRWAVTDETGLAYPASDDPLLLHRLDTMDLPREASAAPNQWTRDALQAGPP